MGFDLLLLVGSTLEDEALGRDSALPLGQEPGFARLGGHDERSEEACNHGDEALEEEDVSPGVDAHGFSSPFGNPGEAVGTCEQAVVGIEVWKRGATHPVAKRPPKAPAREAAET